MYQYSKKFGICMLHCQHKFVSDKAIGSRGFILFPILILMVILSLFGLYALTSAGLAIKMQSDAWDEDNLRAVANVILKNIEKKVSMYSPNCFIHISNPAVFSRQPLNWWLAHACHGYFKNIHYYYVIENLGEDVCTRIKNKPDLIAKYQRITLFSKISNQAHVILQSTIAKAKKTDGICSDKQKHIVMMGKQMQRELIRRVEE